jgi:modulator of FtsH protease
MINTQTHTGSFTKNKILSDTYKLLSMTLVFAGLMAFISMQMSFVLHPIVILVSYFGMLFMVHKNKQNKAGIFWTFGLTGLLGFTLGPLINHTIAIGQSSAISSAFIGTGLIFLVASQIGKNSEKDFSSIGKFAGIGLLIAFVVSLVNYFVLQATIISVALSAFFLLLSSLIIVWQINSIVRGGETNYVTATVTLFVSLYNIFSSLLHLLGVMGGED